MIHRENKSSGSTIAEFAIVAPVLVILIVLVADFSRLFYSYLTLTNCSRNGALHAADPTDSPYANAEAEARADASNLPSSYLTANAITQSGSNVECTLDFEFQALIKYPFPLPGFDQSTNRMTLRQSLTMRTVPTLPNFP